MYLLQLYLVTIKTFAVQRSRSSPLSNIGLHTWPIRNGSHEWTERLTASTSTALIVRIHWDLTIDAVHAFKNTKKKWFWFHTPASKVHFRSTEGQTFYWSIMTAVDSIKCQCVNSGMTGQVGGFQNRGVCQQAFPSFLPQPLPALLLAPFFARSLSLVPHSLLLNRTQTLATQATFQDTFNAS